MTIAATVVMLLLLMMMMMMIMTKPPLAALHQTTALYARFISVVFTVIARAASLKITKKYNKNCMKLIFALTITETNGDFLR